MMMTVNNVAVAGGENVPHLPPTVSSLKKAEKYEHQGAACTRRPLAEVGNTLKQIPGGKLGGEATQKQGTKRSRCKEPANGRNGRGGAVDGGKKKLACNNRVGISVAKEAPSAPPKESSLDTSIVLQESSQNSSSNASTLSRIDAENVYEATSCSVYADNIMDHLKAQEIHFQLSPEFMENQSEVSCRMRAILIDWIVEVHQRFKLRPETLFLTVEYLDRFMAIKKIARTRLQLLGTCCLWIASKFEEIYQPELRDLEFITDKACSSAELRLMESEVLAELDFELCIPTSWRFHQRFVQVAGFKNNSLAMNLSKFFLELSLVDAAFCSKKRSEVAAAAVYLAAKACKIAPHWTKELEAESGLSQGCVQLRTAAKLLCASVNRLADSPYQAVRIKFSASEFGAVAKEVVPGPVPQSSMAGRSTHA
eukprot:Filipodium_phascolosomae@DN2286_c1_g1_i10.p1